MTKQEIKEKKDLEMYVKIFEECKTEDAAKKYIKENLYKLSITKGCISAYIRVFHADEDNSWLKKAAYVKEPQYSYTPCVDKEGNIIYQNKISKKTGKPLPKVKKVEMAGEKQKVYKHSEARKAFMEKYSIEVKDTGFIPKEKRSEEDKFDIFAGLF